MSKMALTPEEIETVKMSRLPTTVLTADGSIDTTEEAKVYVKDWTCLSRSNLLKTFQRSCLWENSAKKMAIHTSGKNVKTPNLIKNGKIAPCECDNLVPIAVTGSSSDTDIYGSASDSAEHTKESAPSDRDAPQASSDRLQDLPEWLEKLTEVLVDTKSTSSGSDRKDPPEPPRPERQHPNRSKGKHNLFTHFPKDPNCEICKRKKVTRTPCGRNSKSHILRATKFGDIITADHEILNEEREPRYAIVVQDFATQWIQSYPWKTISQKTI